MIFRKVYVSTARADITMSDVEGILAQSGKNNDLLGLTGLLIFHRGRFFQVLEGAYDPLMTCYDRILADPRHDEIMLLAKGKAPDRAFAQWKMGYADPSQLSADCHDSLVGLTNLTLKGSEEQGRNERVQLLMTNFLVSFGIYGLREAG